MDNIETLKQKIEALEIQITDERIKHEKELQKIKTENYDALEASQTRYQAELEIQRTNFQRQIAKLKGKLECNFSILCWKR